MVYAITFLIVLSLFWETSNSEVVYIPKDITTLIKCYNKSDGKEVHLNITNGVYTVDNTKLALATNGSLLLNRSFIWTPNEVDQRIPMDYYGLYKPLYTAVEGGYIVYTGTILLDDPDITTKCAFGIPVFDDLNELHKFLDKEKFMSINETAHCFTGANRQQTLNYSLPINRDIFIGGHAAVDNISLVELTIYGFLFEYDVNKLNKVKCSSDDGSCTVPISGSMSNSSEVCVLVQIDEDSKISIDLISRDKKNSMIIYIVPLAAIIILVAIIILAVVIAILFCRHKIMIMLRCCCKKNQQDVPEQDGETIVKDVPGQQNHGFRSTSSDIGQSIEETNGRYDITAKTETHDQGPNGDDALVVTAPKETDKLLNNKFNKK